MGDVIARHGKEIVEAIIGFLENLDDIFESKATKDGHNWPAVTAIEKLDRHMPTRYPFRREKVSWQTWPPFTGMRVELGGD